MRNAIVIPVLAVSALGLGACLGPEHDPHFLPWQNSVYPGNSPGVMQYSTNPYPAPDAPPLWTPRVGPGGSFGR